MILSRKNLKNVRDGLDAFDEKVVTCEGPFCNDEKLKSALITVKKAVEKKLKQRPKV